MCSQVARVVVSVKKIVVYLREKEKNRIPPPPPPGRDTGPSTCEQLHTVRSPGISINTRIENDFPLLLFCFVLSLFFPRINPQKRAFSSPHIKPK